MELTFSSLLVAFATGVETRPRPHNAKGLDELLEEFFPGEHSKWELSDEEATKFVGSICAQMLRSLTRDLRAYQDARSSSSEKDLFGAALIDQSAVGRLYAALGWIFNLWRCPLSFEATCQLAADSDVGEDLIARDPKVFRSVLVRVLGPELKDLYGEIAAREPRLALFAKRRLVEYIAESHLAKVLH